MFDDNSGGFSTIRIVLTVWMLILSLMWAVACIHKKELIDIPTNVVTLTVALSAIKGIQRFGEKSEGEKP